MRTCACGCGTEVRRQFAHGHNRRRSVVEYSSVPTIERLLPKVAPQDMGYSSPCWCWQGGLNDRGYGQIGERRDGRNKNLRTHRVVYEALVGPIPDGLALDHLCEVKTCVNPAHLEPVTIAENNRRHSERHFADRTHCKHGHSLRENSYVSPNGKFNCRACNKIAVANYLARKSEHGKVITR